MHTAAGEILVPNINSSAAAGIFYILRSLRLYIEIEKNDENNFLAHSFALSILFFGANKYG
jgi:hypothetical protein